MFRPIPARPAADRAQAEQQPVVQPANQPAVQRANQSAVQPANQPANLRNNRPASQRIVPLATRTGVKAQKIQKSSLVELQRPQQGARPAAAAAMPPQAQRARGLAVSGASAASAASVSEGAAGSVARGASASEASDDLMHFVSMTKPGHSLPSELWGEIARFSPRKDLLALRQVSSGVSHWVDKSIKSLTVSGDNAGKMLEVLSKATNLKHIQRLKIHHLRAEQYPTVMQALSKLPLAKIQLSISCDKTFRLSHVSSLALISPLSLSLDLSYAPTVREAEGLSSLPYTVNIWMNDVVYEETELLNLSAIANMSGLVVVVASHVSDRVAQALSRNPALRDLEITTIHDNAISNEAIAMLASNPALRSLRITDPHHVFDEAVLAALGANRHLTELGLTDYADETTVGIDAAGMMMLSKNTTLEVLHVAAADGVRHLANMPSLHTLILVGSDRHKISAADAGAFAQRARLKSLTLVGSAEQRRAHDGYQSGALAKMLGSSVESICLTRVYVTTSDVTALLANKTVRRLKQEYVESADGANRGKTVGFSRTDFANTYALAMHPRLDAFEVCYDIDLAEKPAATLSNEDRELLLAAWTSAQRPASAFLIDV